MQRNILVIDKNYNALNPMQFGTHTCDATQNFGPAVRSYWLLHYVVSGQGYFDIGKNHYSVKAGDIFVIPPYVETHYWANKQDPWSYVWIGFTAKGELPVRLDDITHCPQAARIFEEMEKCESFENGRSAFLSGKLWELFSYLAEQQPKEQDPLEAVLDCIHTEFTHPLTVQELAQRVNLDRSYLTTLFTQRFGVSPGKYLLAHRMKFAAKLLTANEKNVSVTAISVGYNDIYTFSRAFKQYYGISPQEYAKRNKVDTSTHPPLFTK